VVEVAGQAPARDRSPSREPSHPAPNHTSSGGGLIKHTVHVKEGLVIVALTPILKVKLSVLGAQGDPVGEILAGLRLEELERDWGHNYYMYAFRVSGECLEVESSRFRVWCRDLAGLIKPGTISFEALELESLVKRLPPADSARLKQWVDRLLELDRELSEADSKVVELLALSELPRDRLEEAVKGAVRILCVEGLRTVGDGRPAPLPTYSFECAKTLESELNIKKWLGRLYILFGGKWLGEPESVEILQAIMVRTYEAHSFHEFNWKYTTFEKEVLNILRAKAESAEPVRGVKSWDYLIIWRGTSYELRRYNGEFVVHDIMARVRPELLDQARAKGYNARQLAEAEAPGLVEILKSWVGEPYWLTLLELVGYTTTAFDYPLHKAFMLLGKGSNGKSTFLKMLRDILGRHNIASIQLQAFASLDYRFLWSTLVGKLVNIFADLPKHPMKDTGVFKVLTGDDELTFDRKNREPRSYTNYAKLIFSANELPKTIDLTHAFFRRWIIIDFPNIFPEDPTWYNRNITPEVRDQALTVGLEAVREVLEREAFTGESDVRERWLEESDPLYRFIKELERLGLAKRDPNGRVRDKDLFMVYSRWARIEGAEFLTQAQFTSRIQNYGVVKRDIYYVGIKLLDRPDVIVAKLEAGESGENLEAYQ
jgi:P4 family phage/plasmid primase-like protien